ncbi:MAG TPA: isopentenyl-diphosphate Delta-isomerase [Cytophagales bacterium]|nr:isopentenyl-diphosphate Delta-isomerase [Cytophagales bacterium]
MNAEEQVILVDSNDKETGTLGKTEAHKKGLLHRAFSVFIFNEKGEIILQQRALDKYHSPGLWTNTCCSHPRSGEEVEEAAHRRLTEEMGFDTKIEKAFDFIYKHSFGNGLTEHEFDHVYTGIYSGKVNPDPEEVYAWKTISMDELQKDVSLNPNHYTIWFKIVLQEFLDKLK